MSARLEETLERIADSLEKIAKHASHLGRIAAAPAEAEAEAEKPAKEDKKPAAKKAAAKKADTKKDDEDEDADKGPTKDAVRKALQDFMAIEGKETAIELLKENTSNDAENLSQLEEDDYGAVLEAIEKAS